MAERSKQQAVADPAEIDPEFLLEEEEETAAAPAGETLQRRVPHDLAGLRADLALGRLFPEYSRSRLQTWLKAGQVRVNGRRAGVRDKVWPGDLAEVPPPPPTEEGGVEPEDIALAIVHEDASLLVLHKPAGLVVHPGNGNRHGTLQNGLLHLDPRLGGIPRAGIVHRLDKETSGLMVVARTLTAHTDLVRQLQARSVRRHYTALVVGIPAQDGTVDASLGRHPTQRTRMAVLAGGRHAVTHYFVRARASGCARLECRLETGRTHQIRVHMQHLGHPLIGDPVYGAAVNAQRSLPEAACKLQRQALHAFRLGLVHPESGQPMEWEIPLEDDLAAVWNALERHG